MYSAAYVNKSINPDTVNLLPFFHLGRGPNSIAGLLSLVVSTFLDLVISMRPNAFYSCRPWYLAEQWFAVFSLVVVDCRSFFIHFVLFLK